MTDSQAVWIYIGRRMGSKLLYCWLEEGHVEDDAEYLHLYYKQIVQHAAVGARYTMTTADEDGSIWTRGDKAPVYEGPVEDTNQVALWQLADRSAAQRDASYKQQKRDKDKDVIRETLLPIRQLLHGRKAGVDKSALFDVFTAEFWRPLTKDEEKEMR